MIAACFALKGTPVSCELYGNGHINTTCLVRTDTGNKYILQKINRHVFHDPEALMRNIAAVTGFLRRSVTDSRSVLNLVPTRNGEPFHRDEDGEIWRVYDYVSGSIVLERAETPYDFRESGAAFGRFQRQLTDFDATSLIETIPKFHDTPHRYAQLKEAIKKDTAGRVKDAEREISFAMERESCAQTLMCLQTDGTLPLRVTHNDTKLNNVLFDRDTRKALCVIDLDTVMPGLAVNDFGDSIRFGASTAAEDETDLDKVSLSLELFEAYTVGYLSNSGLTDAERACLCDGAKMMTLECGIRFLADYLSGDVYFRTARPGHNLDRARTQLKLVADMERKWDEMRNIVEGERQ